MKLLVITSLKEYLPAVSTLLQQAGVAVYSVSRATGMRTTDDADLLDDWFGSATGEFDSVVVFSFTTEMAADKAMNLVNDHNKTLDTGFPLRAFVLPVERTSELNSNK